MKFYFSHHQDVKPWVDQLVGMMDEGATIFRSGVFSPGMRLKKLIEDVDVAAIFLSARYLADKSLGGKELQLLRSVSEDTGLPLLLIIVKPCAWQGIPLLSGLTVVPSQGQSLLSDDPEEKTGLVDVKDALMQMDPVAADRLIIRQLESLSGRPLGNDLRSQGRIKWLSWPHGTMGLHLILRLQSLTLLNLRNVNGDLSPLSQLKQLSYIRIIETNLSYVKGLEGLPIERIELNNCVGVDPSALPKSIGIIEMHNCVVSSTQLPCFENLRALAISSTHIDTESLLRQPNLLSLRLADSNLVNLPKALFEKFKYLNQRPWPEPGLHIRDLPLESPPLEVVSRGRAAVMTYFEALEKQNLSPVNQVKAIIIGEGEAGKTSLTRRLLGEPYNDMEPKTHGIYINDWPIARSKSETALVKLWDFGGQQIMHATHQFFLSKRSLYVIVQNCREDNRLDFWLQHAEGFGGDAIILVVLNKIDENPGFSINERALKRKYNIHGFYRLSCKTGEGVDAFRVALEEALLKTEMIETLWPSNWFLVKQSIEKLNHSYQSYEDYRAICREHAITDDTQADTLLDFLHDLGVVLHFRDSGLDHTQVLNPHWATEGVYRIINAPLLARNGGRLTSSDLKDILEKRSKDPFTYPRDKYGYLIGLMKKFELCYPIDDETFLVPDLLPDNEPEFEELPNPLLRFAVTYEFLPPSILPRLMVKVHRDIIGELRWRSGMVLSDGDGNTRALVYCDRDAREIRFEVGGPQRRDYFATLLYFLREIHDSFESLKFDERVLLPGSEDVANAPPYAHLLELERRGERTFLPYGAREEYDVSELLGTVRATSNSQDQILAMLVGIADKLGLNEEEEAEPQRLLSILEQITDLKPGLLGVKFDLKKLTVLLQKRYRAKKS